ncbi:MAG: head maturation protease, ClpP-related [Chloroflexota bacterium]
MPPRTRARRRQLRPVALAGHPTAGPRPSGLRVVRPAADAMTSGGVAEMYLYDAIDAWGAPFGVSAREFVGQLLGLNCAELHLHLNSGGGDYFEAVAMYNALVSHPANLTVHVDGLAASAASVVAMAGERLVMGAGAQLMIHQARTVAAGTSADMTAAAALLDTIDADISQFYADRAAGGGGDAEPATWRALMVAETWYGAAEAVAAGLADEVAGRPGAAEGDDDEPAEGDPAEGDDDQGDDDAEGDEPDGFPPSNRWADLHTAAGAAAARWVAQWTYPGRAGAPDPAAQLAAARAAQRAPAPRPAARRRQVPPPPPAAPPAPPALVIDPDMIRTALRKATT